MCDKVLLGDVRLLRGESGTLYGVLAACLRDGVLDFFVGETGQSSGLMLADLSFFGESGILESIIKKELRG